MSDEDDERLFFPGYEPEADDARPAGDAQSEDDELSENGDAEQAWQQGSAKLGIPGLSADQEKAVQLALSGLGFIMVAIKPTDGGADFFTAVHGDHEQIADAHPHLDGVIERALRRHGVIE